MSYDVIVVGAGSAGCVLAARLSEDPTCEVLLLEAGPDYSTREQLPWDLADGSRLPSDHSLSHDWGLVSTPARPDVRPVPLPRGRVVGGSSAVNGTFALRGFAEDYDAWAAAGNPGWGFDDVLAAFRRLETDLDFPDRGAVVHTRGRLHGVEGLVVADASIMPGIPRANTNLPTLMLAERIAAWLTAAAPAGRPRARAIALVSSRPGGSP